MLVVITSCTADAVLPFIPLPACSAGWWKLQQWRRRRQRRWRPPQEDGGAGPRRAQAEVSGAEPGRSHPLPTEEESVGVVAGEESGRVDAYKPAAAGGTRSQHTHTCTPSKLQGYLVFLCLFPERGDVIEVRGGSTEADSADP